MRIVILGAGFGGLELSTTLSDEFGEELDIVLIDKSEGFVFGFSKLDVMFGRKLPSDVLHPYRDLDKPGLRFVQATIRSIDPSAKRVDTDAGVFDADIMVVALGADLDPGQRRASSRPVTSSTRSPGRSPFATCCRASPAVGSSSASPRRPSSAHRRRARWPCWSMTS